ncbi:BrnT family toxin [Crenobacter luteus]|uniref:hypothetical protein n=1 Tax=Crenobacter luteus TaxID=1452487 RepID=UPI0012E6F890|nr:hypothetical protein [Crenobacter luteus]
MGAIAHLTERNCGPASVPATLPNLLFCSYNKSSSKRSANATARRVQAFAYVYEVLTVLTLVYVPNAGAVRRISLRRAHSDERSLCHEWLANHDDE